MNKREYCCVTKEGEEYFVDAFSAEQAINEVENIYGERVTECYLNDDYLEDDLS